MNNEHLYEAIKRSLLKDICRVYKYYKEQDSTIRGVELKFNVSHGFGEYIYTNTDKLIGMIEYFNENITFPYRLIFEREGEEEFYPLMD